MTTPATRHHPSKLTRTVKCTFHSLVSPFFYGVPDGLWDACRLSDKLPYAGVAASVPSLHTSKGQSLRDNAAFYASAQHHPRCTHFPYLRGELSARRCAASAVVPFSKSFQDLIRLDRGRLAAILYNTFARHTRFIYFCSAHQDLQEHSAHMLWDHCKGPGSRRAPLRSLLLFSAIS